MAKYRVRDYGVSVGKLPTGRKNMITDVPGVRVGHVTLHRETGEASDVCTGVTAILPHSSSWFDKKVTAAGHVINGYGKTTGLIQINELGVIESPIMLTNTLAVPAVAEGTIRCMLAKDRDLGNKKGSVNVVVGECNDGYLNNLRGLFVRPEHAGIAIERALESEDVDEGNVGAGTGMRCFGWKGGIGTASRVVSIGGGEHVIGTLVLTNFGESEDLTILGVPVGRFLRPDKDVLMDTEPEQGSSKGGAVQPKIDGSIMIVLATDLPLTSRQLGRLAKRAVFGLARTGSIAHHGSGDIVIAFSTADASPLSEGDGPLFSLLFRAVVESTEEAILNSLAKATTTVGMNGRVVPELPMDRVVSLLRTWSGPLQERKQN